MEEADPAPAEPVRKRAKKSAAATARAESPTQQEIEGPAMVPDEDAEGEEGEGDASATIAGVARSDIDALYRTMRTSLRRLPKVSEIAESLGVEEADAKIIFKRKKGELDRVRKQRQRAKISGYNTLASDAGYGKLTKADYTMAAALGTDSQHSILGCSEVLRMCKAVPAQAGMPSYGKAEFAERIGTSEVTLPRDVARVLVANVDSIFKNIVNKATRNAVRQGAARVRPSHVVDVLKDHGDLMHFTAVLPADGLVAYCASKQLLEGNAESIEAVKSSAKVNGAAWTEKQQTIHKAKKKIKKAIAAKRATQGAVTA